MFVTVKAYISIKIISVVRSVASMTPSEVTTVESVNASRSFHESMKIIIVIANCFGLLPVSGVRSASAEDLNFKWNSPKVFYSLIVLTVAFIKAAIDVFTLIRHGFSNVFSKIISNICRLRKLSCIFSIFCVLH